MNNPDLKRVSLIARVAVCTLILLLCIGVSGFLASRKKPPQERKIKEHSLLVSGVSAQPGSYAVPIRGFGELRVLNSVSITPQVSGVVTAVHSRLDVGESILAQDVLFAVDDRDYRARHDEARANLELAEQTILRLEKQAEIDTARIANLTRNHELAYAEWRRVETLLKDQQVGTQANAEAAERAYNQALDQTAMLDRAVQLYPAQIMEARSQLKALQARLAMAALDVERCVVRAPIEGRLTRVAVEIGQLVGPAQSVLALADDRTLELQVAVDSRDARDRLPSGTGSLVGQIPAAACSVQWTEAAHGIAWTGRLDRVIRFDESTRTLIVAVRLDAAEAAAHSGQRPREGMFCRVDIPATPMRNTYKLPRSAVNFEGEAYLCVSNRLRTVAVDVAHIEGSDVYVAGGINPGDQVITTRLLNPLEGSRLEWENEAR